MSMLGWLHFILAMVAICAGAVVLTTRKGTARHRLLGRVFLGCMLTQNAAALAIYRISGGWTMFHTLAILSLLLLASGMIPLWLRRPRGVWLKLHGSMMAGAYIGLVTAGTAQVATSIVSDNTEWAVWMTMAVLFAVGGALSARYLPQAIENTGG